MTSMVKSLPAWIERPPHVTEYAAGSHDELVRDLDVTRPRMKRSRDETAHDVSRRLPTSPAVGCDSRLRLRRYVFIDPWSRVPVKARPMTRSPHAGQVGAHLLP